MGTEFFIEIHPGMRLETIIGATKKRVIETLGNAIVDDPAQTKFLRDSPHFTMQVAHVTDYDAVLAAYKRAANDFAPINFTVDGVGHAEKGGLVEVHATVIPEHQRKFRAVHEALIAASIPYLAQTPPAMFPEKNFSGYALENLRHCHFPPARDNYKPHASIGRFNRSLLAREDLQTLIADFQPQGEYTTGHLIAWEYIPNDPTFGVRNPRRIAFGARP